MVMFVYDAKHKSQLDYWDSHPLVIPFGEDAETFIGINCHYAPPMARAFIFDQIMKTMNITTLDENSKIRLTYRRLQRIAAFRYFAPLIHRYRKDHVRSKFVHIPVDQWQTALFLPTANWQKANARTVYADYRRKTKK